MKKLLALDQSSRITGWAVFADGKLEKHGKFDAEAHSSTIAERLNYIRNKVRNLIEENDITEVILEDIQMFYLVQIISWQQNI